MLKSTQLFNLQKTKEHLMGKLKQIVFLIER